MAGDENKCWVVDVMDLNFATKCVHYFATAMAVQFTKLIFSYTAFQVL